MRNPSAMAELIISSCIDNCICETVILKIGIVSQIIQGDELNRFVNHITNHSFFYFSYKIKNN